MQLWFCNSYIVLEPMVTKEEQMATTKNNQSFLCTRHLCTPLWVLILFKLFVDEHDTFGLMDSAGHLPTGENDYSQFGESCADES